MNDEHDPNPWAPTDGEPVPESRPPEPAPEESPWAPATERSAAPPPLPPEPSPLPEPAPPATESVSVGPVVAEANSGSRWLGKSLALVAALVLIGGGGFLAFNAGNANGGADTPAEALESMLGALASGDLLAASELVVPSERDTLIAAGFDLADELVRLEVLAADLDLSSVNGINLAITELDVSEEFPRSDLAHLFVERAVVSGSIDGGLLPWGSMLSGRTPDGWPASGEPDARDLGSSTTPIVAVEVDGRWYLSLWYSVAENARIEADQPLPDLGRRPAQIGAASPDEAISRFVEELLRLDVRRMIGMLDPDEARALYDYSPLFLDGATRAANEILVGLEESGWTWEVELLGLSSTVVDGDLATTQVGGFALEARGQTGSLDVEVSDGTFEVGFSDVDFWGDPYTIDFTFDGDCYTTARQDPGGVDSTEMCPGEPGDTALGSGLATSLAEFMSVSVVTHRVDDRWFISPTRTGAASVLSVLNLLSDDNLGTVIDAMYDLADGLDGGLFGGVDAFAPPPALDGDTPAGLPPGFGQPVNGDLLGEVEVAFAFDLDEEGAAAEIALWAPVIGPVPVERGLGATVVSPSGEMALTVLVTPSAADADAVAQLLVDSEGITTITLASGQAVYGIADTGVIVGVTRDRVVVVAPLGADPDAVLDVALLHLS